jgi:hypothetical protein
MEHTQIALVLLATAWGPRFGGLNVFNVELARSLNLPRRAYQLVCVVASASSVDIEDANRHGVLLAPLFEMDNEVDMGSELVGLVRAKITPLLGMPCIWIGHDTKTGPLALALRERSNGDKSIIVHHMAFGAYQDHKKGDSNKADEKREAQLRMFADADLCFAVGPMLRDQLTDQLSTVPNSPRVEMLIPGLSVPDPEKVALRADSPRNFTAFLGGRLDSEDEPIKQARLGVRAFGLAVGMAEEPGREHHAIRVSPTLRMRGVPLAQHQDVREACTSAASGKVVNFDLADYTEDRNVRRSPTAMWQSCPLGTRVLD